MWKHLEHPNIVPLLGVTVTPFQSISVWMSGGELSEYIGMHPRVDRLSLVGLPLYHVGCRTHPLARYPTLPTVSAISTLAT